MENKELSWLEQAEIKCLKQLETDLQQFLSDIFDVKRFQNEDKNLVARPLLNTIAERLPVIGTHPILYLLLVSG